MLLSVGCAGRSPKPYCKSSNLLGRAKGKVIQVGLRDAVLKTVSRNGVWVRVPVFPQKSSHGGIGIHMRLRNAFLRVRVPLRVQKKPPC